MMIKTPTELTGYHKPTGITWTIRNDAVYCEVGVWDTIGGEPAMVGTKTVAVVPIDALRAALAARLPASGDQE